MEKSKQGKTDSQCFELFSKDPKGVSMEVINGSHRYIAMVITDKKSGPTIQSLIKIFSVFARVPIKNYVFTRMTKPILLELALCIIQEIASNGIARARTLQLEVIDSKSGGKTVRVADEFGDGDEKFDEDFLGQIDEAIFCFKDKEGKSPDKKFSSGQGHKSPYSPFGEDGAFITPKKKTPRSLEKDIEV